MNERLSNQRDLDTRFAKRGKIAPQNAFVGDCLVHCGSREDQREAASAELAGITDGNRLLRAENLLPQSIRRRSDVIPHRGPRAKSIAGPRDIAQR